MKAEWKNQSEEQKSARKGKIFVIHVSEQRTKSQIFKEFLQLNTKTNPNFQDGQSIGVGISAKMLPPNTYSETVFSGDSKGNANLRYKELPHLLEWLASKRR